MSENTSDLATAYCAAFAEITNAIKNTKNPHLGNHYADLGSVLATVRPVLARHGLSVLQVPGEVTCADGVHLVSVMSVLMHTSGQQIVGKTQVPIAPQVDKKSGQVRPIDAQRAGSAITYARRYALAAICGITQQDDDGEAASASPEQESPDLSALLHRVEAAGTAAELELTREDVRQAGDRRVADAFITKSRGFQAAAKGKAK